MSSIEVRPFRRSDRDQVTDLVNAHIQAVVPGISTSVNAVLSQLEREPGEFIVDPWVVERATLVAEQRGRIAAAAHLLRYDAGEDVGESYRDAAEIRWLAYWPNASYWPDADQAAKLLVDACLARLDSWGVSRQYADGAMPGPGVYGVPEQWPHIRSAFEQAGFVHEHTEIVLLALIEDLPRATEPPVAGLAVRRTLGVNGTRLSAYLARTDESIGYVEVDTNLEDAGRIARAGRLADIGNLEVVESHREHGVGRWLLGQAADWLRMARVDRLLAYANVDETALLDLLRGVGFRELTRTTGGWERT
jgi:ribosomal protein S18 acetylase RimI-like enzyme